MSPTLSLAALALMHALVDASALLIAPLWPGIESRYSLGAVGLSAAFIVQSLPTNISQLLFGWLRDRRSMRMWIWLGPVIAALALPAMGSAENPWLLFLLLAVGGVGVGAFHPEAAVAAGRLLPESRTRALSIFMLGGSLGMTMGPLMSGAIVSRWGMAGLIQLTPLLLLGLAVLYRIGRIGAIPVSQPPRAVAGTAFSGRRGLALGLLLLCSLRLAPNMAMDKVLSYLLAGRGATEAEIGRMQSLFLASACGGMCLMAIAFRGGNEKRFLVLTPLLCAPLLWLMSRPDCSQPVFIAALLGQGAILWGTTPAMVSYAQQQFPQGAGFASALTMGLSWGVAGLIQTPVTVHFRSTGEPGRALVAFVPCLLVSSLGACFLPGMPSQNKRLASDDDSSTIDAAEKDRFPDPGTEVRVFENPLESAFTADP